MSFWSSAGLSRRRGRRTMSRVRVGGRGKRMYSTIKQPPKKGRKNKRRETKACVL